MLFFFLFLFFLIMIFTIYYFYILFCLEVMILVYFHSTTTGLSRVYFHYRIRLMERLSASGDKCVVLGRNEH